MLDANQVRLGKRAPVYDPNTLKAARYLDLTVMPAPPSETSRAEDKNVKFGMFANDQYGDCTDAGMANAELFWSALSGTTVNVTTEDVLAAYAAVTGFKVGPPGQNDNGANELDTLNWWRKTGIAGNKIDAFAALSLHNRLLVKTGIWMFDGAYLGVALPATAQGQSEWTYQPQAGSQAYPGSWGGHCVFAVDYSADGVLVATWGQLVLMTWDFWDQYVDEAYVAISPQQFISGDKSAEGFDLATLTRDMTAITGHP